jgi:NADH-quinone oxidoreductase subunit J
MIAALLFWLFAAVLVGSAVMVVTARNPVHGVLFLILAFFNAAALFVLAGAEFLAMILIIVYVGAVAVLFLFVVMMLDISAARRQGGWQAYLPVGLAVGAVLFAELVLGIAGWKLASLPPAVPVSGGLSNTAALAGVLYTRYLLLFQASGLVLLVAMIGAIVLTLREHNRSRRQDIGRQLARDPKETVVLVDVPLGRAPVVPGQAETEKAAVAPGGAE